MFVSSVRGRASGGARFVDAPQVGLVTQDPCQLQDTGVAYRGPRSRRTQKRRTCMGQHHRQSEEDY